MQIGYKKEKLAKKSLPAFHQQLKNY